MSNISIVKKSITAIKADAIVNAANSVHHQTAGFFLILKLLSNDP